MKTIKTRTSTTASNCTVTNIDVVDNEQQIRGSFTLNDSPFGNCQNFCIAYFDCLLYSFIIDPNVSINYDNIDWGNFKEVLRDIKRTYTGKPLLIIDVHRRLQPLLEKHFGSSRIKIATDYLSTNDSDMCIMLINLNDY